MDIEVSPIPEAVKRIAGKTPVASRLRTAEWARLPLELREAGQFSAGVERARVVSAIQQKLQQRVAMETAETETGKRAGMDRSAFVREMRKVIAAEGIPLPEGKGALTDIGGKRRLDLIYQHQTQQAAEYARFKVGSDPDVLAAYPAQELVRVEDRKDKRAWPVIWASKGGAMPGGRMVALKSDPIWAKISRFGTPYPPFDFGSGMGLEDIERDEAEALGLIAAGEEQPSPEADFNAKLEASVANVGVEGRQFLRDSFGDQLKFVGERAVWQSDAFANVVEKAARERQWSPEQPPTFGRATSRTGELSRQARPELDLEGTTLTVPADRGRHLWDEHGPDSPASDDNIPLKREDMMRFPDLWRRPDRVVFEGQPGVVVLEQDMPDDTEIRVVVEKRGPRTARLITGYRRKKRKPPTPDAAEATPESTSETPHGGLL